jgi:two-component system sensor histidine kinase KdpD
MPVADIPISDVFSAERERERVHRQMLSSVSHDLKTPLASIIGSLEVYTRMKDKLPAAKQAALIGVALQEAYRLDTFITNILDMARLENNAVKPKRETVEIGPMLRNCLIRLDHHLQGKAVDIEAVSGPLQVDTDAVLLSRAVCLVIDNAVKYGGSTPAVRVEFGRDDNGMAYIRVRDNGPGIPEPQMEAIFSKYTRLSREDQQNAGTGLGLAIAREIMRLLGGRIIAQNHPEGGVLMTLSFPPG